MVSLDVVNDPRPCDGIVFYNNLNLVKVGSYDTNVGIKNHPSMNGSYIRFILSQGVQRKSAGDI